MRAQSELLSSVILVTLTIVVGVAGFYLANSWASSRYSENAFNSFAELASNEFLVFPISFENRGSSIVAYVGVMRMGVLRDNYSVAVSIYNSSLPVQTQRWWDLSPLSISSITYNISAAQASLYNLSFASLMSISTDPSKLYAKYSGSWYSLKDLGARSVSLYRVNVTNNPALLSTDKILFLNATVPTNTRYIYVVIWVSYGDRYIAIPSMISVS